MSDELMSAAKQLSSMADKVAGFAISSYLLLIFACLKDIGPWVHERKMPFVVGTLVSRVIYVGAVWWLYSRELYVLLSAKPPDFALLSDVSLVVSVGSEPWDRRVHTDRDCSRDRSQQKVLAPTGVDRLPPYSKSGASSRCRPPTVAM